MPHRVTQTESTAFTSPCTLHSTHTDMNSMDCLTVFFCPADQVSETELCLWNIYICVYTYTHTHSHLTIAGLRQSAYPPAGLSSPWSAQVLVVGPRSLEVHIPTPFA